MSEMDLTAERKAVYEEIMDEHFPEPYLANNFLNSSKRKQFEEKFNTVVHD